MEIQELANIMYDDHGPAKIGLQLQVEENNKEIEGTESDLFEFLLNILLIGIIKFGLQSSTADLQAIEDKLQVYFKKINVNVFMSVYVKNTDPLPFCQILFDGTSFALRIMRQHSRPSTMSEHYAIYQKPDGSFVRINFEFAF